MKAFIFDLNGPMVHDMDYHPQAWQHLFNHEPTTSWAASLPAPR